MATLIEAWIMELCINTRYSSFKPATTQDFCSYVTRWCHEVKAEATNQQQDEWKCVLPPGSAGILPVGRTAARRSGGSAWCSACCCPSTWGRSAGSPSRAPTRCGSAPGSPSRWFPAWRRSLMRLFRAPEADSLVFSQENRVLHPSPFLTNTYLYFYAN